MKRGTFLLIGLLLFTVGCLPYTSLSETNTTPGVSLQTPTGTVVVNHASPEPVVEEPSLTPFITPENLGPGGDIMESIAPLTITILYDNNAFDNRLRTEWGFAALVQNHGHSLLFDTGGDGLTLIENMRLLEINPGIVEKVVLSHIHGDHTGGLYDILEFGAQPVVYVPPSFPASFKQEVQEITKLVEVEAGQIISEDIFTTGEMGRSIAEQALVIKTEEGLVIITGCAHPGITAMVEQAQRLFGDPIYLVLGGFHLGSKTQTEIDGIIRDFRRLGVEKVAPCHCTGDLAIAKFASEYKENFLRAGVGRVIIIGSK